MTHDAIPIVCRPSRAETVRWSKVSILLLVFLGWSLPLGAEDIDTPGDYKVIFYEGSYKGRVDSLTLDPDQTYLVTSTDVLTMQHGITSVKVGKNVGVMLRYDSLYANSTPRIVICTEDTPNLGDMNRMSQSLVMFNRTKVSHPEGVRFCSERRLTLTSGSRKYAFYLANEEQPNPKLIALHGMRYATVYGPKDMQDGGTKLEVTTKDGKSLFFAQAYDGKPEASVEWDLGQAGINLNDVARYAITGIERGSRKPFATVATAASKLAGGIANGASIVPGVKLSRSLTGDWDSNLGRTSFVRTGDKINGALRFTNGPVAMVGGTLQGNVLDFTWHVPAGESAFGQVTFAADGNSGKGSWTKPDGTTGSWNLKR